MRKNLAMLASALMLTASCTPDPGLGGMATVTGVVMIEDWNSTFTNINSVYPAMREDIFLVFGDEPTFGEDVETHFDGTYRFQYLYPGKYTLYAYSDRLATPGNTNTREPVKLTFEITEKRQILTLDTLYIRK